jgi:hypothetical protein
MQAQEPADKAARSSEDGKVLRNGILRPFALFQSEQSIKKALMRCKMSILRFSFLLFFLFLRQDELYSSSACQLTLLYFTHPQLRHARLKERHEQVAPELLRQQVGY